MVMVMTKNYNLILIPGKLLRESLRVEKKMEKLPVDTGIFSP